MLQDTVNPFIKVLACMVLSSLIVYDGFYIHVQLICIVGGGSALCVEAATVRHKECHLLLPPDSTSLRCAPCIRHRSSLQIQAKRLLDPSRTAPSSHVNHRYLSRLELIDRLGNEHHERRLVSKQYQWLKARIKDISEKTGVSVDPELHEGLKEIVLNESDSILKSLPPNSFRVSKHLTCV